ncbi:MAG: acyl-CoA dehydrogenase [Hyphomicrobiales bacterium]|nr:MAG: acyl-CoA dehydrogenase [Hyphomicrobiales bacterium]
MTAIARPSTATTEELDIFRASFRTFLDRHAVPNIDSWRDEGMVSRDVWRKAGEAGFLLASCPEELGGAGGDYRHEAIIIQELAKCGCLDFNIHLHSALIAPYIYQYCTAEQQSRWLPGMRSGELVAAIAMSEPSAGSDLKAIRTQAVRDGDSYVLSGQKTFISNGHLANLLLVACKTDAAAGSKGLSLIAVETDKVEGFSRGRLLKKIGMHAQDTAELFFDNVRVPVANLVGEEGRGFPQMMEMLPQERLTVAVIGLAVIDESIRSTLDYVRNRQAFGKTVFDFQNTRFVLAAAKAEAEVARVFVDNCISRLLDGELDAVTAAMAKLWVSERQMAIVDNCLQLFGGYGYTLDYPIARMWADARIQRIYGGTSEIMCQRRSKSRPLGGAKVVHLAAHLGNAGRA